MVVLGVRNMKHGRLLARLGLLVVVLAGFFVSFKLFGKGTAGALLATTQNPFMGLFGGILATTLV